MLIMSMYCIYHISALCFGRWVCDVGFCCMVVEFVLSFWYSAARFLNGWLKLDCCYTV